MTRDRFACCVLCERSEETKITGALSTKDGLTAHQNCLLFASGLACTTDKPEFDDLFGFSVEEVKKEVKRGRKLTCFRCRKRGAVSGCDVKRCQKSFHFPCAVEDKAEIIENFGKEEFRLFCLKHSQTISSSSTSRTKSSSFKRRLSFNERSEKKKKKAKRLHSDSSSNSDPGALIPPIDSDFDESTPPLSLEKTLRFAGHPSNSGDSEVPIGDRVEVVTSDVKNHDLSIHSDAESESLLPLVFSHGQLRPNQGVICLEKEVQTIKRELDFSPAPSPTHSLEKLADEPVPEAPPSQEQFSPIPASSRASSSIELAVCEPTCVTYISSSCSSPAPASDPPLSPLEELPSDPNPPQAPPSDPDPALINSAGFWRKCNMARCTQALFSEFIKEMNEICRRIQSDQASQEDYDNALSVMKASGRLKVFVDKQHEELQRKQAELQVAAAAMKDVVSGVSVLMG
uniref:PHD finger protein 11 n=1 Tax=Nothobranchius kadleci TaxID=1051664 RepID=A0A1A8C1Q8_NOTKA